MRDFSTLALPVWLVAVITKAAFGKIAGLQLCASMPPLFPSRGPEILIADG